MLKANTLRWIGLIGAALSAVALVMNGHINEGIGVMAAALSSAGVIPNND